MRILQIHNYYATRGGECSVVDAEKRLLESLGHQVIQYTRNSGHLPAMSVGTKAYDYWNIPSNPRVARDLGGILSNIGPDVAHVHNVFPLLSPAVYTAIRAARIPLVQTVHNFRFLCPSGTFFRERAICEACQDRGYVQAIRHRCMRGSYLTSAQYARAIRRVWASGALTHATTRIIALNKFSANKLTAAGVPAARLEICGNFASRIAAEISPKDDYFLYMGRLSPEKGIHILLEAMKNVPDARLKIAGAGPLEAEVRRYAQYLPNVEVVGYVDGARKERLISRARALIVPSEWYENFPISVVEAMSLGTPVVASRIGGLPEMVDEGLSGLLFEPHDLSSLVRCLNTLSGAEAVVRNMSGQALCQAKTKFGADVHGMKLEEIYGRAIAQSTQGYEEAT